MELNFTDVFKTWGISCCQHGNQGLINHYETFSFLIDAKYTWWKSVLNLSQIGLIGGIDNLMFSDNWILKWCYFTGLRVDQLYRKIFYFLIPLPLESEVCSERIVLTVDIHDMIPTFFTRTGPWLRQVCNTSLHTYCSKNSKAMNKILSM